MQSNKKIEAMDAADAALTRNPYLPVSLEERAKEKARIRAEQAKNRPRLLDCLDPTVAKRYEDAKPLYEWIVECKLFRPATAKTHAHMENVSKQVVAQNEADAWAYFCDLTGEWPSRRDTDPKITRLKRRTLRASDDSEE
jgi:hypothetical protein